MVEVGGVPATGIVVDLLILMAIGLAPLAFWSRRRRRRSLR